jgi:Ca-activated chloride channel family protein
MIVVFKVTPSMTAEDVQPARLERGKQKLHDLLEMREGGATGLIAYSGSAHLVMPLTRDGRIIDIMAEGLEPGIMPVEGDALADALIMAGSLFKQAGRAGSVLVIADTVSPAQVAKLNQPPDQERPPVQFLAVTALGAPADQGLENAANALGARVAKLTIDASDLEAITRQARRDLQTVLTQQSGERWKDSGYALVPLIVLAALPWARRGWQVSD